MKKVSGIWQLATLMMIHFFADMIGGVLAGILPCIKEHFSLGLKLGVIFLATRSISSNFFQIIIGSMRKKSQKIYEKAQSLSDINERMEATIHDISLRIEQFKV